LLANGGISRCDPGEHVLPIIRRLLRYAQLAGWLANPRRILLSVSLTNWKNIESAFVFDNIHICIRIW
jgi:hypothetical protein